jgi:hypothetical protein
MKNATLVAIIATVRASDLVHVNAMDDATIEQELSGADIHSERKALAYLTSLNSELDATQVATRDSLSATQESETEPLDTPDAPVETSPEEVTEVALTASGNPHIHTPDVIAIIGEELAAKDADARATGEKRDLALTLPERQTIKQAKRRLTLAATKAAVATA